MTDLKTDLKLLCIIEMTYIVMEQVRRRHEVASGRRPRHIADLNHEKWVIKANAAPVSNGIEFIWAKIQAFHAFLSQHDFSVISRVSTGVNFCMEMRVYKTKSYLIFNGTIKVKNVLNVLYFNGTYFRNIF